MAEPNLPPGFKLDPTFRPELPEGALPEGFVLDRSFNPTSTGEDILRSAGAGLATGAAGIPGMVGDVQAATLGPYQQALEKVRSQFKPGSRFVASREQHAPQLPTTEDIKRATGLSRFDYQPQTTGGKYAETIASFLPGAALGGARTVGQGIADIARFGVLPGAASQAAGDIAGSIRPEYEAPARAVAGLLTPFAASKLISPNASMAPAASREAYARQVARLEQEGIPVSAGERTDSRALRQAEDELNPEHYKHKAEAFTRAATRQVGNGQGGNYEAGVVEHGAGGLLDRMLGETGARFDALQARNNLEVDPQLVTDLLNTHNNYTRIPGLFNNETINTVRGVIHRVGDVMRTANTRGVTPLISGDEYQTLVSDLRRAARGAAQSNPDRAEALHDITSVLDNAMERSIQQHNPADAGAFAEARRDYKNALVIEDASKASNVAGAQGYITPAKLEAAAAKIYTRRGHERGRDPFDFAPAGKAVLKIEPNSGTAGRLHVSDVIQGLTRSLGAGAGFAAGHSLGGGNEGGVAGLLLGQDALARLADPLARSAARAAVTSRPGQAYLGNQLLAGRARIGVPGLLNAAQAGQQNAIPAFAEGGIVDRPTVGLLGENGPEAVVPLSRIPAPYHYASLLARLGVRAGDLEGGRPSRNIEQRGEGFDLRGLLDRLVGQYGRPSLDVDNPLSRALGVPDIPRAASQAALTGYPSARGLLQ
jgi:hypothetical protein